MSNKTLDAFIKARNAVLLSLDRERIMAFYQKWDVRLPTEEEVFWAGVHKARTAARGLPLEARALSKRWLIEHGYRSWDDGDVPA